MRYDVFFTAQAEDWLMSLDDDDYDSLIARVELLEKRGRASDDPSWTRSREAVIRT